MARRGARGVEVRVDEDGNPIGIGLDPDANRQSQLAAADEADAEELASINREEGGEYFRVTDEIRATDNVRLIVTRLLPSDKKGYVCEMTPAEFTHERLRSVAGPGKYRVSIMGPRGYLPGGGTVTIAESTALAVTTPQESSYEIYMRMMREQEDRSQDRMIKYATIFAPVIAALMGNRGPDLTALVAALKPPPAPSLGEIAQTMAALKNLSGGGEEKESSLDQMMRMAEFVRKIEKGEVGETTWLDLVKEGITVAKPALERIANSIPALAAPSAGEPAPLSSVPNSSQPPATLPNKPSNTSATAAPKEDNPMLQLIPWLRQTLAVLIQHAAKNKDPSLYAEVVLDNLPDGISPAQIAELAKRPDWFAQLKAFSSGVGPYEGWFTQFGRAIIETVEGPEEDEDRGAIQPRGYTGEGEQVDE